MSRQLRIQFPGAVYHVTSRGDRRLAIVGDDTDRNQFFDRVGATAEKFCWQIFAVALMTNHFHLFFRTPQPNLSVGMQFLLGGYACWWNARQRRTGHVFQGRFGGHLVEDETYFWTVSRYVHLNPTPVLVSRPEDWPWSSYGGYVDPARRLPWIDYDALLTAWQGTYGESETVANYRRFVESSLLNRPPSPFASAIDGWILGSQSFADRVQKMISPESHEPTAMKRRRTPHLHIDDVIEAVCQQYEIAVKELSRRGSRHPARAIVAYMGHRYTGATLREIAAVLGLSRPDSVPTQLRRVANAGNDSTLRAHLGELEAGLGLAHPRCG